MSNKRFIQFLTAVFFFCLGASVSSCEKEQSLTQEEILYKECKDSVYDTQGYVGWMTCVYGSLEECARSGDANCISELGFDPNQEIFYYIVEVEDSLNLVTASAGYKAEIKEELEFFANAPQYGKFIDWEVNHALLGRDSGPRSNPVKVTYPMVDSERTVSLKPRYKIYPEACPGGCETELWIDNLTQPNAYTDDNGFTHIEYNGGSYFTVKMQVSEVDDEYSINGIPLIQTRWDSDYFVILENLQLAVSYYRPFGLWTQGFAQPIANMHTTINLNDALGMYGMTNIVGYTLDDNTCLECPYSDELFGVTTQVNSRDNTTQNSIYLNEGMVGDTLTIYTEAKFAYDNLYGREEIVKDSLRIIVQ